MNKELHDLQFKTQELSTNDGYDELDIQHTEES